NDDLLTQTGAMVISRASATGFVSGATLGSLSESNTYDTNFGEPSAYTVTSGSTTLYSVDYGTRDALGRIVDKTETIGGVTHQYHYGYDVNGRLIDVFNDGVAPGSTAW